MLVINTNVASLNAQRNLSSSQSSLSQSIQRLSTGLRVNSAKDDAAGMAIASRMESQVRGMNVGIRNANDAISFSQTAEGALGKVADMMQRMRELAVQAANGTNTAADRGNLDAEYKELGKEIDRTLTSTKFNGVAVLGAAGTQKFQVGANANETIDITTIDVKAQTDVAKIVAPAATISDANGAAATTAITDLDAALTAINSERAKFGAAQNRFEAAIGSMQVASENQAAARSRIVDADFASETAKLSRAQILQQAGTAMLAQANSASQGVLSLLR